MATKEEILDSISGMTVLELSELLKDFRKDVYEFLADDLHIET